MNKKINQKLINLIEYYNLFNANLLLSNKPIKRTANSQASPLLLTGSKIEKLAKLKKKISTIKNCDLKSNATNLVFGDGNINSKIMIVGEGPGAQEDILGKPFIGRAGKLLDKMLESINLNRQKVYISNIVNYRPPENRRPTEGEIARYLPYILKHIETINPKILVLLGSTALNSLIGNEEVISKVRGKWIQKEIGTIKPWIIISFHPAFLMRQPQQKKLAWIDLKMIRDKIKFLKI
jgi:uracil-DNA glycosylase